MKNADIVGSKIFFLLTEYNTSYFELIWNYLVLFTLYTLYTRLDSYTYACIAKMYFLLETIKLRVIVFYPWVLFIYIFSQIANLTFLTSRNLSQPSMIVCSWEPGSSVTSSQLSDSPSDSPSELGSPTLRAGEWWLPSAIPHYALNQTTGREKNHNVLKVIFVLGLLK